MSMALPYPLFSDRNRTTPTDYNRPAETVACEPHLLGQHSCEINALISSGAAKITEARSPIMPAPTIAGAPFSGPSLLESVLKRRFRSQKSRVLPSAVVTR